MWPSSRRRQPKPAERIAFAALRQQPAERLATVLAGEPRDSIAWIDAAARYGLVEAQLLLGQMLLDGRGTERDPQSAFRWFSAAADAGCVDAVNMVGRCHELGWGVAVDWLLAVQCYRQAAEGNLDWGQYNLANMLLRGRGVARDRAQALAWYQRAANQGHAKSMNLVGRFYEEGWGVATDLAVTLDWYRRAAEGGDFRGQYNFGSLLIRQGRSVEAYRWLEAAVQHGTDDFLAAVNQRLLASDDPVLRRIGAEALRLLLALGQPGDKPALHQHDHGDRR